MRNRVFAGLLALGIPGVILVPVAAIADKPNTSPADGGATHYDPDNVSAISKFMESIVQGNTAFSAKDYTGAIDTYKRAIAFNPRNPLGPYLLGEAYLATGNLGEAEAAFKQAEELSDSKDPVLRSHVLFVVADVYEREKKWDKARDAWVKYNEHAKKVGADSGVFPSSGAARLKVIEDWLKLEKSYQGVRERILAERNAGKGDAGKASDAGKGAAKK